jgi:predicted transcriptional regulator
MFEGSLRILASTRSRARRTHLEIIASILDTCLHYTKRTQVMSQCNMSYPQCNGYLDLLLKANLLSIENDRQSFLLRTTSKGKDFLKAYNSVLTMME